MNFMWLCAAFPENHYTQIQKCYAFNNLDESKYNTLLEIWVKQFKQ